VVSLMLSSVAAATVTISQTDSEDPATSGDNVTYSITLTSPDGEPNQLWISNIVTKPDEVVPAEIPYVSISTSQGSCQIGVTDLGGTSYSGAICSFPGGIPAGGSISVQAVVKDNYSMDHRVALFDCDPTPNTYGCNPRQVDIERTDVIHPPTLAGSKKIKVTGLPDGCATGPFKPKAKAKGDVRSVSASLSGPNNEYGLAEHGSKNKDLGKEAGNKLKAKVGNLKTGYYQITFLAQRKGASALKTFLTFQVC
jgi:hypothetical protein